jgi:predicted SAM-dependent methyltransferase
MIKEIQNIVNKSPLGGLARPLWGSILRLHRKKIIEQYLAQHDIKKLQLGCGSNILHGWLNSSYLPGVDNVIHNDVINLDATGTYPFEDQTFDYIFSEHMIEHVSYAKGQLMLKESFRVLRDGGKIRISTPDLAFLISLYQTEKSDLQKEYLRWCMKELADGAPFCEDTFVINNFVRSWGHTFIYDEKVLRFCLENAGFKEITKCALNKSEDVVLRDLERENRMPEGFLQLESLTLEATKKSI